jgi:hypothetical protein
MLLLASDLQDKVKKMNKLSAKAINTLRQKVSKFNKEEFNDDVNKWREVRLLLWPRGNICKGLCALKRKCMVVIGRWRAYCVRDWGEKHMHLLNAFGLCGPMVTSIQSLPQNPILSSASSAESASDKSASEASASESDSDAAPPKKPAAKKAAKDGSSDEVSGRGVAMCLCALVSD